MPNPATSAYIETRQRLRYAAGLHREEAAGCREGERRAQKLWVLGMPPGEL